MTGASHGRHRAPCRPITPLTVWGRAAHDAAGVAGRRTAVAVASGSLLATGMVVTTPVAVADTPAVTADVQALTAPVRAVAEAAPAVVVAETAVWTVEDSAITVKAAPKPEPVIAQTPTRTASAASRSAARTASSDDDTDSAADDSTSEQADASVALDDVDLSDVEQRGQAIVDIAKRYIGIPYVYGGSTPAGFDCSGFTSYVYDKVGIDLPRTSSAQRHAGQVVSADDALPGDLVWNPGHIAIYVGNGKVIDSPRPGKSISIRKIWYSNPVFIRLPK